MESFLPNLDDYRNYQPTKSCYLDGRYFNLVFGDYPGLIREPLVINLSSDDLDDPSGIRYTTQMKNVKISRTEYPGLLHVIIQTPNNRHANLIILRYQEGKAFWFDPYSIIPKNVKADFGRDFRLTEVLRRIIKEYLNLYFKIKLVADLNNTKDYTDDYNKRSMLGAQASQGLPSDILRIIDEQNDRELTEIDLENHNLINSNYKIWRNITGNPCDANVEGCSISGYCVAYCIKYAYDFLKHNKYSFINIRKFASKIESMYGKLLPDGEPPEYGWYGNMDNYESQCYSDGNRLGCNEYQGYLRPTFEIPCFDPNSIKQPYFPQVQQIPCFDPCQLKRPYFPQVFPMPCNKFQGPSPIFQIPCFDPSRLNSLYYPQQIQIPCFDASKLTSTYCPQTFQIPCFKKPECA